MNKKEKEKWKMRVKGEKVSKEPKVNKYFFKSA